MKKTIFRYNEGDSLRGKSANNRMRDIKQRIQERFRSRYSNTLIEGLNTERNIKQVGERVGGTNK